MRIDAIHNRMDLITGKIRSAYFSPEQKDEALDIAGKRLFNDFLATYGTSQESIDALKVFKVLEDFETDSAGIFTIPGCARMLSAEVGVQYQGKSLTRPCRIVNEDEKGSARDSQLKPINLMYPVIEPLDADRYLVEPVMETGGKVKYLKFPEKPKFYYTEVDENDNPVYVDAGSVQMKWSDLFIDRLIFMAIGVLGIPISSEWMVQNGFMIGGSQAKQ